MYFFYLICVSAIRFTIYSFEMLSDILKIINVMIVITLIKISFAVCIYEFRIRRMRSTWSQVVLCLCLADFSSPGLRSFPVWITTLYLCANHKMSWWIVPESDRVGFFSQQIAKSIAYTFQQLSQSILQIFSGLPLLPGILI